MAWIEDVPSGWQEEVATGWQEDIPTAGPGSTENQMRTLFAEGPKPKPGFLKRWQDYRPGWDLRPNPESMSQSVAGNVLQEASAPLMAARDIAFGVATGTPGEAVSPREMTDRVFGPPSTDWRKNVISGIFEVAAELAVPLPGKGYYRTAKPGMPAPPMQQTGSYSGEVGRRVPGHQVVGGGGYVGAPEFTSSPTGEYVLPNGELASTLDLAAKHQAEMLAAHVPSDQKTGAFWGPWEEVGRAQPDPFGPWGNQHMRTDYLSGTEHVPPDTVRDITKPRGLRSAEEMIQERKYLGSEVMHGSERPPIRETRSIMPTGHSESATAGAEAGANEALAILEERARKRAARQRIIDAMDRHKLLTELQATDVADGGFGVPGLMDGLEQTTLAQKPRVSGALKSTFMQDTLTQMGQSGPVGRAYELRAHRMAIDADRKFVTWMNTKFVPIFEKWVGARNILRQYNPFELPNTGKAFNMSQKDIEEFVNYAYTMNGEYGKVLTPTNPKIKGLVDELMTTGMRDVEMHQGVRLAMVLQPDGKMVPVGIPGKGFYTHNPVSAELKEGLSGRALRIAYDQAIEKGWKGFSTYNEVTKEFDVADTSLSAFKRMLAQHPDKGFRRFNGLELSRVLDATMGGTRKPYEVLKELGYGVDPLKDLSMWGLGALRRGEQILAEPELIKLRDTLVKQLEQHNMKTEWVDIIHQRITGRDIELIDKEFNDVVTKMNNATNFALLTTSGIPQFNQISYIAQRYGIVPTLEYLLRRGGPEAAQIVEQSGARMPYYLQMYTNPTDAFGRALHVELQLNGMTAIDRELRLSAAVVADQSIRHKLEWLKSSFGQMPTVKAYLEKEISGVLREHQFSQREIDRIMERGVMELPERLRFSTAGAHMTQGLVGWRGQSSNVSGMTSPVARLFRNLKNFMFTNLTEDYRSILRAREMGVPYPTIAKRAATGLAAAWAVGELTNDALFSMKRLLAAEPETVERDPKWLQDAMGSQAAAHIVNNLAAGKGHLLAAALMASSDSFHEFMLKFSVGAAPDLAARMADAVKHGIQTGDWDKALRIGSRATIKKELALHPKDQGASVPALPRIE